MPELCCLTSELFVFISVVYFDVSPLLRNSMNDIFYLSYIFRTNSNFYQADPRTYITVPMVCISRVKII